MRTDIMSVVWKEWRELRRGEGRQGSTPLVMILLSSAIGGLFGWNHGASYVTAWVAPIMGTMMGIAPTIPLAADTFAGERERHTLETLLASRLSDSAILAGKSLAIAGYGWVVALAYQLAGIIALAVRSHQLTLPPGGALLFGVVGSLLAIASFSQAAVLLSLRCETVRAASQRLLYGMLAVGFVPWLIIRKIVPGWGSALSAWAARSGAAAVSAACLVVLLAAFSCLAIAARRVFRRDAMLLEH